MNLPASMPRRELGALLVVLAVLVLLPVGRMSELPILLGALIGIGLLVRHHLAPFANSGMRLILVLFACYWVPAVLSGFTAVMPQKSWMTALEILRFLPFAFFVAWAMRNIDIWRPFQLAVAAVCVLWILDAWVQIVSGHSIAGAPEQARLSGIFGAENLKLGPVLAVLSPFVLMGAREKAGRWGLLLAFVLVLVPILMAGSRAAWLTFALVTLAFGWRETGSLRRFFPLILGAMLGIALCAGLILRDSERFDSRIEKSLLVLQGTGQAIDEASAGRLRIWHAALGMIEAHPLTGVGVRGFRYDYAAHAIAGDAFVDSKTAQGASHAHQIVLEVLTETGLVGLVFWILGSAMAVRSWRRATPDQRTRAFAPGLALSVMCFPLNSHFAFYSAWWGLLFWWLLAIFCAALAAAPKQAQSDPANDRRRPDQHRP